MKGNRRTFIKNTLISGITAAALPLTSCGSEGKSQDSKSQYMDFSRLDEILKQPVFKKELFSKPVIIKSIELLNYNENYLCRISSEDGVEGISVGHPFQQKYLNSIFINRVQPFFIGKDARDLESLMENFYFSNYKLQGLAIWIPFATLEFAILDLMGKVGNMSIGELIGTIHNPDVSIYTANGDRGISAEETMERIEKEVEESQAKAVKFKVGGRMRRQDNPAGRSENLIKLMRKTYGSEMVLYADSNGSYTVDEAISIGKILEDYKIDFYEEPVPFDEYEETRQVSQALSIPIAGGEQEPSLHQFRWLLASDALQIVQPDQFYFGGMIRSMKVARMAEVFGKVCTPHMSAGGIGNLYVMHFVSAIPNAGPFHEFKGLDKDLPIISETSSLLSENGVFKVPTGPGLGITIDPDFINKHQVLKKY
jgi:L-alanine-DL-glutamate epimerase-like enolase superfamily enzyme